LESSTTAEIEIDYGPKNVVLRIKDNGRGFDHAQTTGPNEGHFGLLGITERAKRLGAECAIQSQPASGTLVIIRVALEQDLQSNGEAA